jgi:acyl-CoA thioesterase FadM
MPRAAPFIVRLTVAWGDCDPSGTLYPPRFADYVAAAHFAWFEWLTQATTRRYLAPDNMALPAKAISVEFHGALYFNELIEVTVNVAEVRTRSFRLAIEAVSMSRCPDVGFSAQLSLVCIDKTLRETRPLPPLLRQRLIDYADLGHVLPAPASARSSSGK